MDDISNPFSPIFCLSKQHQGASEEGKRNAAIINYIDLYTLVCEGLLEGIWPKLHSKQCPVSGWICCLYREHAGRAGPEMWRGDKPSHATRHTRARVVGRPGSIPTPHTHREVWTIQVSICTAFTTTSETALRSSQTLSYVPYSK